MFRCYEAYAFRSRFELGDFLTKLNELGPWEFIERDSESFGDYLSARVGADAFVKIYARKSEAYDLDIKFRSGLSAEEAQPELEAVRAIVMKLLAAIDATDIAATESHD